MLTVFSLLFNLLFLAYSSAYYLQLTLQLTAFSLLPSAYCLQLTAFSLLCPRCSHQLTVFSFLFSLLSSAYSSAYCLQLIVPKMQPSRAVWRIGDGCIALIFKDKWIPWLKGGRVVSPISILPDNAMVNQLIDGDSKWLNFSLID
nr:hypothetical protein CFP56_73470 [Quercus suber]